MADTQTPSSRFTSLIANPPAAPSAPAKPRQRRGSSKTITCQKCGEVREPAMKHAIFCKPCSDALVEEANKPKDTDADALFAKIAKNNAWGSRW